MRARIGVLFVAVVVCCLSAVVVAWADEPAFVRWLSADEPGDQTIRDYWERAERDELSAPELVDLGTMVFYRGFPTDAVRFYKRALDLDSKLYEAWFRLGLVAHNQNDLDKARQAYQRCLKQRPGHGWCNFYLGLLEEQLGHSTNALDYYERSFRHAPELANPRYNPAILSSKLVLGAMLRDFDQNRFEAALPMSYLQPAHVRRVRRQYEPTPAPVPDSEPEAAADASGAKDPSGGTPATAATPRPIAKPKAEAPPRSMPVRRATPVAPAPTGSDGSAGSSGSPVGVSRAPIGNTSDEAHIRPWWPRLSQTALVLVLAGSVPGPAETGSATSVPEHHRRCQAPPKPDRKAEMKHLQGCLAPTRSGCC